LLTGGSRTAVARQTLRATLDWSYDLLAEPNAWCCAVSRSSRQPRAEAASAIASDASIDASRSPTC
jgi:predicted ATPase